MSNRPAGEKEDPTAISTTHAINLQQGHAIFSHYSDLQVCSKSIRSYNITCHFVCNTIIFLYISEVFLCDSVFESVIDFSRNYMNDDKLWKLGNDIKKLIVLL